MQKNKQVQANPRFIRYRELKWKKARSLAEDDKFLTQTENLRKALDKAFQKYPREIGKFFSLFGFCTIFQIPNIGGYLATLRPPTLKKLLRRYVRYALRFDAFFALKRKRKITRKNFVLYFAPPKGSMFGAILKGHELEPRAKFPPHLVEMGNFEEELKGVPGPLNNQIKMGEVKYIQIDDRSRQSLLTMIEQLMYEPESVGFIEHKAERPYLFLMIGEKASKETLRELQKSITAFQRERMGRRRGGRPVDIGQLRRFRNLSRKPGSAKVQATKIMPNVTVQSAQNASSRYKKKFFK